MSVFGNIGSVSTLCELYLCFLRKNLFQHDDRSTTHTPLMSVAVLAMNILKSLLQKTVSQHSFDSEKDRSFLVCGFYTDV